jgi:hypothetical protein
LRRCQLSPGGLESYTARIGLRVTYGAYPTPTRLGIWILDLGVFGSSAGICERLVLEVQGNRREVSHPGAPETPNLVIGNATQIGGVRLQPDHQAFVLELVERPALADWTRRKSVRMTDDQMIIGHPGQTSILETDARPELRALSTGLAYRLHTLEPARPDGGEPHA